MDPSSHLVKCWVAGYWMWKEVLYIAANEQTEANLYLFDQDVAAACTTVKEKPNRE